MSHYGKVFKQPTARIEVVFGHTPHYRTTSFGKHRLSSLQEVGGLFPTAVFKDNKLWFVKYHSSESGALKWFDVWDGELHTNDGTVILSKGEYSQ